MSTILSFIKEINSRNKSETSQINKTSNNIFRPVKLSLSESTKAEKMTLVKKKLQKKMVTKRKSFKKITLEEQISYKVKNIQKLTKSFRKKLISILSK